MSKRKEKAAVVPEAAEIAVPVAVAEKKFSKSAILASDKFVRNRDVLKVVLTDGVMYSVREAELALSGYLEREV